MDNGVLQIFAALLAWFLYLLKSYVYKIPMLSILFVQKLFDLLC